MKCDHLSNGQVEVSTSFLEICLGSTERVQHTLERTVRLGRLPAVFERSHNIHGTDYMGILYRTIYQYKPYISRLIDRITQAKALALFWVAGRGSPEG